MKDVSIEYAHIYTNSKINEEHKLSLKVLDSVRTSNSNESLVVMVDDYSFPDPTFDYKVFVEWLAEHGHRPNIVMRESQLIPVCDQVLAIIENSELKEEILNYIKAKKYSCSLFIASWYLLRLGKFKHDSFSESEYADKLVNILPESFKPFEDKGLEIIQSTRYSDVVSKIENRYFKGRLIV